VWQAAIGAAVSGDFGPSTEKATKSWQIAHALTPDGVVGPLSWATVSPPWNMPAPRAGWLLGVDTSAWQGVVDWPALKAVGVGFGIVKATEGAHTVDPLWSRNSQAALDAGVLLGSYHVFHPQLDPALQAASYVAQARTRAQLFPVIDLELRKGVAAPELLARALELVRAVESAWQRGCVVYTGPAFMERLVREAGAGGAARLAELARRPLWNADYTPRPEPVVPPPWAAWTLWQFAGDRGYRMPNGVVVDVNWFRGSVAELARIGALKVCPGPDKPVAPTPLPGGTKVGGLLIEAFRAGKTKEIVWTEVTVDDLVITVASDAMKADVGARAGVRLPVSYQETISICAALGCVAPTQAMCDAMFAQARAQLGFVALQTSAESAARMGTVDFALEFADGVEKQMKGLVLRPGDLVFGAWKLWILNSRIARNGAVNYGFWDKRRSPPAPIQGPFGLHDAEYYDYSQLLQPVKRMARKVTGERVDLLEYIAQHDQVPVKYLDPYRAKAPI
jgi:GH25 family lysozyme M1 (1,4-beta-N-acetylmuramidase)